MQSIASLMSIGRASDIGDMGDLEEEEDMEDDSASRISDATASRISEMTSQFNTSVTEEDGSAQAVGMTNGPVADHSMYLPCTLESFNYNEAGALLLQDKNVVCKRNRKAN